MAASQRQALYGVRDCYLRTSGGLGSWGFKEATDHGRLYRIKVEDILAAEITLGQAAGKRVWGGSTDSVVQPSGRKAGFLVNRQSLKK